MEEKIGKPVKFPELIKLETIEGEWVSAGAEGKTREHFRKACDGFCYLTDIESETPAGLMKGHGIVFYDQAIKKFRMEWYDNFTNYITGEGKFTEEGTFIMIEKYSRDGRAYLERHTDKVIDGARKLHTVENFINGEFKKLSEMSFDRVGPAKG